MLKSMTGFGKAEYSGSRFSIKVEIKTLNSKFLDLNFRLPQLIRERENLIRALLNEHVQRGKTDVTITCEYTGGTASYHINKELLMTYMIELKTIAKELNQSDTELLPIVMKMPDVLNSAQHDAAEEIWQQTEKTIIAALEQLNQFRKQEGQSLMQEFEKMISSINTSLISVETLDPQRMTNIRERLNQLLNENIPKEKIDTNRLEQELIFYIERLDISEEKQRLQNHCQYFLDTMRKENNAGRKLSFIVQEMGREINTLGSKANHAAIQQYVVMMKDELERIKEQLMNVL